MEEEKYQKELFEFEQPKRSFSKLTDILPKADFEGRRSLTLTIEKAVFISIGVVMAMVVVYALGVESGRSRSVSAAAPKRAPAKKAAVRQPSAKKVSVPAIAQKEAAAAGKTIIDTAQIKPSKQPAAAKDTAAPSRAAIAAAQPYSIAAAAFRTRESAEASLVLLRKQDLSAFIMYQEPYYRVYVGVYDDRNDAKSKRDLEKVRRVFKDAFIKKR